MSRGSTFALYRAYTKFKVPEETLKRVVWNRGALDGSGGATAGRRRGRAPLIEIASRLRLRLRGI